MPPHFPPGTALADGKYRVVRLLGAGGMGAVYEAENTTTHKRVAIKCLRPGHASDDIDGARLVREAKASARIRHPNVVDVYDVVRSGSFVCLVMEYLEGEPLSALLERGRLSVGSALALLVPVLRGVGAAHRQGVIHRDIKPANIYLAREEDAPAPVPKLLDFGVSKLGEPGIDSLVLTRSGQIIGTPLYMPLEQFMGDKDIDARADIYALGVVLYEALTGQPPFRAESLAGLIVKLTSTSAPPPQQICPDVPEALGAVIMKALARDRAERFANVEAMLAALAPFGAASTRDAIQVIPRPEPPLGEAATVQQPSAGQPLRSTGAAGPGNGAGKRARAIAAAVGVVVLSLVAVRLTMRDGRQGAAGVVVPNAAPLTEMPAADAGTVSPSIGNVTAPSATLPFTEVGDAAVPTEKMTTPSAALARADVPDAATPRADSHAAALRPRHVPRLKPREMQDLAFPRQKEEISASLPKPPAPPEQSRPADPLPLRIRVPGPDEF